MSKWQGTPVPNTGYVENVYFNTALSWEETFQLLGSLTYVQTPFHSKPLYPILFSNTGSPVIFVVKDAPGDGNVTFEINYATDIVNEDFEYIFKGMIGILEPEGLPLLDGKYWGMSECKVNNDVISNYSDISVGLENDKLSSLISITPFTKDVSLNSFLTGIADAIRSKKGTTDKINASNFASEINSIESGGMNLPTYATQDELDIWYDFLYYDSLKVAITDINNATIGTNAIDNIDNAEVIVYSRDAVANIMLLKDINLDESLEIISDVNFILNGYSLKSSTNNVLILKGDNSIIDGRIQGSEIINNVETGQVATIKVEQGSCKITGGKFTTTGIGNGTSEQPDSIISTSENTTIEIDNAILQIDDNNGGTIVGILVGNNTIINVLNCQINANSKRGYNVCGLYGTGTGEATLTNCKIVANADHTANAAGTNYATMSRAIHYAGTLYVNNCYVYGTHSGITPLGDITIKGGLYEGYSHGGVYVVSGSKGITKTARIYDAIVRECPLTEGYIDDGVAGTNLAGMYIGGTNNTTIYIDNCNLSAKAQVIVMKNDKNNTLYISRSFINHDYTRTGIRIDNTTHKVYIGQGCNFDATNTDRASVVTETNDIYRDTGIEPSGTLDIIENGIYDVTDYVSANVNVPIPDDYIKPTGTLEITENGEYTIASYEKVNVNVASSGGGGVVVVDELPTENIQEGVIYQVNEVSDIGVYLNDGVEGKAPTSLETSIITILDITPTLYYYVVDELPSSPNISNLQTFSPAYVYICNDIPYVYGNAGYGNMWLDVKTLIQSVTNLTYENKGYVESNLQIEEKGIYVTYKHGSLGVARKEKYNLKTYDYNDWINYESIFDKTIEKFSHNTIKEIRACAFYDCDKLTYVYLPQVRALRYRSFCDCVSLKTVYLPKCKYIARETFYNCSSLTDIYLGADEVVTIPEGALIINSNHPNVHVRAELLSAYQSDEVWSGYGNIVTLVGDYTD